jgi:hypothetical protein
MSDDKGPKDRLLDLLVYGPAGLAITAAEEFPKLVEKGRHRVEGQLHAARLVGQFAVQMGRRQVEQTVGGLLSRDAGAPPAPAARPGPSATPDAAPDASAAPQETAPPSPASAPEPSPVQGTTTALSPNGTMASGALGIPGYDSLSASQVVQRLPGLSAEELEAVRAYEQAGRGRKTVLLRVAQLRAAS